MKTQNKKKIINDPIYGFINIGSVLLFDIIQHPFFQRLRRIKQLGLTSYVYPGATHTRFEHALGALHLMNAAIETLRSKGQGITEKEAEGVRIAILLHDLGHGPFSHTLEHSFMQNISHEALSLAFMERINKEFNGQLSTGIKIFKNEYSKKFLYQLVSSQLDMDRLDYLNRDSFLSGVIEGSVGADRLIKMLVVVDDNLAIEEKGIYSAENFLIARRIMYWQVYLHKTVVAAEQMLVKIIKRAKFLCQENGIFAVPSLGYFFDNKIDKDNLPPDFLECFANLDDNDIMASIKVWQESADTVLSLLSKNLLNRDLLKLEISNTPFSPERIATLKQKASELYYISEQDTQYLVFTDSVSNKAYSSEHDNSLKILLKSGKTADIAQASDISNISALSKRVEKYFLCYPKECL